MKKLAYILTLSLLVAPTIFYADDAMTASETETQTEVTSQSDAYMPDADQDSDVQSGPEEYEEYEEYEEIEEPSV